MEPRVFAQEPKVTGAPDGPTAPPQQDQSVAYLLIELKYLTDSFWKSEELGERRLTFFITIATAVMAGIVTLGKDAMVEPTNPLGVSGAAFGAVSLWLLGMVTMRRMQRRNAKSDEYRGYADQIRRYFLERHPQLAPYMPFEVSKPPPARTRGASMFGRGGLLETAILITSLAAAMAGAAIVFGAIKLVSFTVTTDSGTGTLVSVAVGCLVGVLFWRHAMKEAYPGSDRPDGNP